MESTGEIFFEFDVITMGMGRFGYVNTPAGAGGKLGQVKTEDDERDMMLRYEFLWLFFCYRLLSNSNVQMSLQHQRRSILRSCSWPAPLDPR